MNTACFLKRFLYTNEINELAKNNFFLKEFFLGTYPVDISPEISSLPCCWIWNTDEQKESGKPLGCCLANKKKTIFF